ATPKASKPPASTAPTSSSAKQHTQQERAKEKQKEKNEFYIIEFRRTASPGRRTRSRRIQANLGVLGNSLGHAMSQQFQGRPILVLTQIRNRFAPKPANLAIGQNGLQPVTNLDAVLMIVYRQKNQHT